MLKTRVVVPPSAGNTPSSNSAKSLQVNPQQRRGPVFAEALLEDVKIPRPRRLVDMIAAVAFEATILAVLILIPLLHTQAIDLSQFNTTYLVAPPPPPPPSPPPAIEAHAAVVPKRSSFELGKLVAPTVIPKQVAIVKDQAAAAPPLEAMAGVPGGVPGGIPGGQVGGVLGGIIGGTSQVAPSPPQPETQQVTRPIRVGGAVRPPRLISRVEPSYPPLAMQAHVQGSVVIDAVIDTQGRVSEMHVLSGNPLLIQAATDALRQWRYEPTLLGGEPVPIALVVTLQFHLQ
jgi:protein TonB